MLLHVYFIFARQLFRFPAAHCQDGVDTDKLVMWSELLLDLRSNMEKESFRVAFLPLLFLSGCMSLCTSPELSWTVALSTSPPPPPPPTATHQPPPATGSRLI